MKPNMIDTFLSRLDNSLRWTGIPDRIADAMSDTPSMDHKHRALRWVPLLYIAFACCLFIFCVSWPLKQLDHISLGALISITTGMVLSTMTGMWFIYASGPLGNPLSEDDERQSALRKDSFLFCLGVLAGLNCLGQPILVILSHWQNWSAARSVSFTISTLILNASLLGCLPTLYASWNLRQLPKE
jgi:hypothetical protein